MLITVDCGTTNMRCRLYDGTERLYEVRRTAGCRDTAFRGSADFLRRSLSECVREILDLASLSESCIEAVVCSGTLASDVGIYRLPHAEAPAGIGETVRASGLVSLPDITSIPIFFIPGIRIVPPAVMTEPIPFIDALESMSGEECEIYGIMSQTGLTGNFTITLPGSYNKVLEVDGNGRIVSMRTGMCGEFIAAISEHTILRRSLPTPVIRKIIPEYLLLGFNYSRLRGLSPSLIKARPAQLFAGWDIDSAANFFVGAILKDDIISTFEVCGEQGRIIVGGGNPLRHIFALLLAEAGARRVTEIDDTVAGRASALGAMEVWRRWKRENG